MTRWPGGHPWKRRVPQYQGPARPPTSQPFRFCIARQWPIPTWYATCPVCGALVENTLHPLQEAIQQRLDLD